MKIGKLIDRVLRVGVFFLVIAISLLAGRSVESYHHSCPRPSVEHVQREPVFDDLLDAIEWVESKGVVTAIGDDGRAVGAYQLTKIYVDDYYRITGKDRMPYFNNHEIRLDSFWSRVIAEAYIKHYALIAERNNKKIITSLRRFEIMARIHNGGPDGWKKESTKEYWHKVKARMNERKLCE